MDKEIYQFVKKQLVCLIIYIAKSCGMAFRNLIFFSITVKNSFIIGLFVYSYSMRSKTKANNLRPLNTILQLIHMGVSQACVVHPKKTKKPCCHAHSEQWQRRWRNELCSRWHHERLTADTENEKQPNSSTISFPPGAKPFPRQQLARWVGPYLRRAAGGEALIGDWGGWRLSGWWASLIAVLLEGRRLASTKLHACHTQISKDGMWEGIGLGSAQYV